MVGEVLRVAVRHGDGLAAGCPAHLVQYNTVQYSTVQYSTVQYSTLQYCTASIVHYSTVQPAHLVDGPLAPSSLQRILVHRHRGHRGRLQVRGGVRGLEVVLEFEMTMPMISNTIKETIRVCVRSVSSS